MSFKNTKIFRKALIEQGYFVSKRNINGEYLLLKKILRNFDYFFDVGFYKGEVSEYVRKHFKKILIYGYDLNPISLTRKKKFEKKQIFFTCVSISNKIRKNISFFYYNARPELSSLKKRLDYNPSISQNFMKKRISSRTLNNVFQNLGICRKKKIFIKIDIDGGESDIIMSLKKKYFKYDLSGYFEYGSGWKNYKKKLKTLLYYLFQNNYKVYRMCRNGVIEIRYFSEFDENYYQSHFFFTKEKISNFFKKKKKILSLSSDSRENFFY